MKAENKFLIFDHPVAWNWRTPIQDMKNVARRMRYQMLTKKHKPVVNGERKYNVSVLAIFKNEARYFPEWIEFHKIVGVDHFYLYNNNSDDNYEEMLKPYIEEGTVTLVQWPKNQAQMECYQDGIARFREETKWMAIIDLDEFIVPNETDTIYDFLQKFEDKPAVLGYWKFFGASGLMERPDDGLVVEDFVVGWRKYSSIGKCFYNTRFDFDGTDPKNTGLHHFMWAGPKGCALPPVNVFGKICLPGVHPIPRNADAEHFPLQINHYFTKSCQEYIDKKSKGDVYFKENPHTFDYFHEHDMPCQKADYHAYKYLIKLKLAMNGIAGWR